MYVWSILKATVDEPFPCEGIFDIALYVQSKAGPKAPRAKHAYR